MLRRCAAHDMAPRVQLVNVLRWSSLLLAVGASVKGQALTPTEVPREITYTLPGLSVTFECSVAGLTGGQVTWYKDGQELESDMNISIRDRRLVISDITEEDDGMYSCKSGNASAWGRLRVLPASWSPQCHGVPSTGSVMPGDRYSISCTSVGHDNTSLKWSVLEEEEEEGSGEVTLRTLNGAAEERRGTSVVVTYDGTAPAAGDSVSLPRFICEASLGGLERSCSVNFAGPDDGSSAIPFVVVGLMSLIALLLFFVVLFFLFRHRQCRFCREPMTEPVPTLDAAALQTGAWIPPPVVAIDVEVGQDGDSLPGDWQLSPPPDVVPAQDPTNATDPPVQAPVREEPETAPSAADGAPVAISPAAQPQSKEKNLTITKNINQDFDKPTRTLEKKAVPVAVPPPVIKPRPTQKREKKVIKRYKDPPVKARMKPKEPIYAQVKKLNVPSNSVPGKPAPDAAQDVPAASAGAGTGPAWPPSLPPRPSPEELDSKELDSKETSSTATAETESTDQTTAQPENDLGGGKSEKKRRRQYRKKSEDIKRNSGHEDHALNIQPTTKEPAEEPSQSPKDSGGTSKKKKKKKQTPADRVIYAELDFSKDVGLNILD